MLRIARTRPGGDKVNWIQSDGQSLRLPQRFNFIYMTGHAIQQLLTDDDAVGLLRAAADHLLPDGRFVFETRNPAAQAWLSWTPEHSKRTARRPQHGRVSFFYDAQFEPLLASSQLASIITCWTQECSGQGATASVLLTRSAWHVCWQTLVWRQLRGTETGRVGLSRRLATRLSSRLAGRRSPLQHVTDALRHLKNQATRYADFSPQFLLQHPGGHRTLILYNRGLQWLDEFASNPFRHYTQQRRIHQIPLRAIRR